MLYTAWNLVLQYGLGVLIVSITFPSFDIIIHYWSSFIFCLSFNTVMRNIKKADWHGLGEYKSSLYR